MKRMFTLSCFCFIFTKLIATEPKNDSIKLNIKPETFDSTITFSFFIPSNDTVSLLFFNRWAKSWVVFDRTYYTKGNHDTICNLSSLTPGKYLAVLGVGTANSMRRGIKGKRYAAIAVERMFTKRKRPQK